MPTIYDQIVAITEDYLGPAAHRFVARQVSSHLAKEPAEVVRDDIPMLTEWTKVTLGLLTEDRKLVSEYVAKMTELAQTTQLT